MSESLKKILAQKKISDYDQWFTTIAEELLFRTHLKINGTPYEIIEIEFYLNSPDHPDIYSHSTEDQKQNAVFCFHKHGPSFKEGSYTGLDIAIGNEKRYGGILIRGLRKITSKKIIDGPSNVVSEILQVFRESKVRDLVRKIDLDISGKDLQLEEVAGKIVKLLRSPRVGLTLKRAAPEKIKFLLKEYRFIKYPELTKKGRHWIIASALIHNYPLSISNHVASRFLDLINNGRSKKINLHHYGHHSQRDDLIELYGALTLDKTRTLLAG